MRLLSTGELARELGVSRASVLKWANDGLIIPAFTTPGGHLRWDLDDVRRQVRELRERGAEDE
jgi:DNA-binding transcriptional MerR regulator